MKEDYQIWHERWCKPKLLQAINNIKLDSVVAEAFYRVFWLNYMHTGKRWVEFRRSRLVLLSEDFTIRRIITDKFIPCFDSLRAQVSEEKLRLNKTMGRNKISKEIYTPVWKFENKWTCVYSGISK